MDPVVINEGDPSAWVDHLDPYQEGHRGLSSGGHHRDLDWEDHHRDLDWEDHHRDLDWEDHRLDLDWEDHHHRDLERGLWVDHWGHEMGHEVDLRGHRSALEMEGHLDP